MRFPWTRRPDVAQEIPPVKDLKMRGYVGTTWISKPCLLIDEDTGRELPGKITVYNDPIKAIGPPVKMWISTEDMDRLERDLR